MQDASFFSFQLLPLGAAAVIIRLHLILSLESSSVTQLQSAWADCVSCELWTQTQIQREAELDLSFKRKTSLYHGWLQEGKTKQQGQ